MAESMTPDTLELTTKAAVRQRQDIDQAQTQALVARVAELEKEVRQKDEAIIAVQSQLHLIENRQIHSQN
jgi:hypothetical protein